jgi:hypothetical protein
VARIGTHTHALATAGEVPHLWCRTTTTRSLSSRPVRPADHSIYADMAAHYDIAILPARGRRRPCDQVKVELAVLVVERWSARPHAQAPDFLASVTAILANFAICTRTLAFKMSRPTGRASVAASDWRSGEVENRGEREAAK